MNEHVMALYVPCRETGIWPGSALVASYDGGDAERLMVDYEGACHISSYADRVHIAWGRHTERYPTVARIWLERAAVTRIGEFDADTGVVLLDGDEARTRLEAWLARPLTSTDLAATSARFELTRELREAARSFDPALRQYARHHAARRNVSL